MFDVARHPITSVLEVAWFSSDGQVWQSFGSEFPWTLRAEHEDLPHFTSVAESSKPLEPRSGTTQAAAVAAPCNMSEHVTKGTMLFCVPMYGMDAVGRERQNNTFSLATRQAMRLCGWRNESRRWLCGPLECKARPAYGFCQRLL